MGGIGDTVNFLTSVRRPPPGELRGESGSPSAEPAMPEEGCEGAALCRTTVAKKILPRLKHGGGGQPLAHDSYLVDSASSHMLVSKIKPCMSKYKQLYSETANGSLNQLSFI